MIIRDRSFPHPVLAPFRDDVSPNAFELSVSVSPDADNYYIDAGFKYENQTLANLMEEGRACHVIHLECRRNFYREAFCFAPKTKRLTIATSELVGRVEVSGFIKAQASIPDYQIDGAHADYGTATFQIQAGDVLAVAHSRVFDAYVDYDPLKQISSILTIQRAEETEEGVMKIDTTGERIVATLSQKDYQRYTDLKGDPQLGPLLANQVVIPALLEGMYEMKATSEEDWGLEMSKRWFRSVSKKLDDQNIDIRKSDTAPFEALQSALRLPLRRSLEGLLNMNPMDKD